MTGTVSLRVVVADDSAFMRKVLEEIIRTDPKLEVVGQAKDGREAITMAQTLQPDVMTMDINMPRMDGLEATRKIRKDFVPETQPRIIAMTANVMKGDREKTMAAGCDGYIQKPIDIDTITGEIEHFLTRTKS